MQRVVSGIQAKLKVGQPGDIYEQEADRVEEPQVQRQSEEGEKKEEKLIQTQPLTKQITSLVQRQVEGEEATGNVLRRWPIAAQSLAPFDVQCAAPTKTPTCGPVELFSEIDMPWPVPNNYFRGSRWMKEGEWKAALNAARKGKCEAKGEFEDIKLRWNLDNPRLGSYWGMDLNENDIEFDINPRVIYAGEPCGPCFTGTASWSFNVDVSRKKGKTIERGKTKTPIKGSITGE